MSKEISIFKYTDDMESQWDRFVLNESINGTILQTRRFLKYHPKERFIDHSLIFMNGTNIIAVMPANFVPETNEIVSHQGSTYGGIIISNVSCKISILDTIFEKIDEYIKKNKINQITLNQTGSIYQKYHSELLDYYYFLFGFTSSSELGYYINLENSSENVIDDFSSSRRRDYRYSLKNDLSFKELTDSNDIRAFYDVLCDNYKKFNAKPVHTFDEILDLYNNRLNNSIRFYGVYSQNVLLAGAMIFTFDKKVFHTQYLAVRQDNTNRFINEFLYTNLINEAKNKLFQTISFGTAVLEHGKVLNRHLAMYKEGYGTNTYINYRYTKKYEFDL